MKFAISNLAFPDGDVIAAAPKLVALGIAGVEIAPTALWSDAPAIKYEAQGLRRLLCDLGLEVSGIQSLLFGHPELQLFDRSSWPQLLAHLRAMLRIAVDLEASVAVFGSPKNRRRGGLSLPDAHAIAAEFFHQLTPDLKDSQVTLTLEPNAPAYGADYLVHYDDTVALAALVDSLFVKPQIDTGCLAMIDDDAAQGIRRHMPAHVHVSAPWLAPPPTGVDHQSVASALREKGYVGWVTLEMIQHGDDPSAAAIECGRWMSEFDGRFNGN